MTWPKPEDVGTWRTYFGVALLVAALADTVVLSRKERGAGRHSPHDSSRVDASVQ